MSTAELRELQQRVAIFNDQEAFKLLIVHFGNLLHYFAYNIIGSKQEAEEIVSDVFIKVWQQRQHLPGTDNLKYYLFKAVKNTALNYLKKNNRQADCYSQWEILVNKEVETPEDIVIGKEQLDLAKQAIDALPPRCREIFILVKQESFSYAEVAELLDISVATVNVQMTIAVKKLWDALDAILPISRS